MDTPSYLEYISRAFCYLVRRVVFGVVFGHFYHDDIINMVLSYLVILSGFRLAS